MNRREFGKRLVAGTAGLFAAVKLFGEVAQQPPKSAVKRAQFIRELRRYIRQQRRGLPDGHYLDGEVHFETKGFSITGVWRTNMDKHWSERQTYAVGFKITMEGLDVAAAGDEATRKRCFELIDWTRKIVVNHGYGRFQPKPEGSAIQYTDVVVTS